MDFVDELQCGDSWENKVGFAVERFGGVGKKVKSGNTNAEKKRQEILNAIEGKLKLQSRAYERFHDQIVEEMNEIEQKKTEEACKWCRRSMIRGDIRMKAMKQEDCRALETREEQERSWARSILPPLNRADPRRLTVTKKGPWNHQERGSSGLSGKRREVEKKTHGGWSQKGKRRCQRP